MAKSEQDTVKCEFCGDTKKVPVGCHGIVTSRNGVKMGPCPKCAKKEKT